MTDDNRPPPDSAGTGESRQTAGSPQASGQRPDGAADAWTATGSGDSAFPADAESGGGGEAKAAGQGRTAGQGKGSEAAASLLATAANIFVSPREAFAAIDARPSKLFPMLVVFAATALSIAAYFAIVDMAWFADFSVDQEGLSEEQADAMRDGMLSVPRGVYMALGAVTAIGSIVVIWLIQAGYLTLVAALRGDDCGFTHWFSLVTWTGLTYLASTVGMLTVLALNGDGQIAVQDLDPLTLTNLGIRVDGGALKTLMDSISLPMIWGAALIAMAYRQWLNASWLRAGLVVGGPYALIIGIVLLVTL